MKNITQKKRTVNVGIMITAIIGILVSAYFVYSTASSIWIADNTKKDISLAAGTYTNRGYSASYAAFGADYYTYQYGATRESVSALNGLNYAAEIQTDNQGIIVRQINSLADIINSNSSDELYSERYLSLIISTVSFLMFFILFFSSVKINPLYVYTEKVKKAKRKKAEKNDAAAEGAPSELTAAENHAFEAENSAEEPISAEAPAAEIEAQ